MLSGFILLIQGVTSWRLNSDISITSWRDMYQQSTKSIFIKKNMTGHMLQAQLWSSYFRVLMLLDHWSQTQFLEGHSSAQFRSNPNQTHLIQLISVFRIRNFQTGVSWSWLELNSAELWPSRNWVWDQCSRYNRSWLSTKMKWSALVVQLIIHVFCHSHAASEIVLSWKQLNELYFPTKSKVHSQYTITT